MRITVWVCPTEGCGNYYGASSAGDLTQAATHSITGEPRGTRARCPDCASQGRDVARVPHAIEVRP